MKRTALRAAGCGLRERLTILLLLGALAMPANARAQSSPLVPLDDIAYAYIDALMVRGELTSLSYLERPYTAAAILRALDRSSGSPESSASWRESLRRAVHKYDVESPSGPDQARVDAAFGAGALATLESSGRRDLMRADSVSSFAPGLEAHFLFRAGPLVGVSRFLGDRRLKHDPEFTGKTDRPLMGRTEDAYVSVDARYGSIFLGRTARNWGPASMQGLVLGHYAYSYDHLHARLGTRAVSLSMIAARLDDHPHPGSEIRDSRYLAAHRVSLRYRQLEAAITEAILYAGQGRGFEPAMMNPFSVHVLGSLDEFRQSNDGNLMYTLDAAWRSSRFGVWSASGLIDDAQVDRCKDFCEEPASYAFAISAEGVPVVGKQRLFASYRRVANLTYRTNIPSLAWTSYGVSLGDGFSDYDELRGGLDLAVIPAATLRAYVAYQRQGEGDYRLPFPTPAEYAATPGFLSGAFRQVARIGVTSTGAIGPLEFTGDVGINRIAKNATTGVQQGFEGRVRLHYRPRWLLVWSPPLEN